MYKQKKEIILTKEIVFNKFGQIQFKKIYCPKEIYKHYRFINDNDLDYKKIKK